MSQENASASPSLVCDDGRNRYWIVYGQQCMVGPNLYRTCIPTILHSWQSTKPLKPPRLIQQAPRASRMRSTDASVVTGHIIIKSVVGIILEHLVDRHLKKNFYGCEVDHPSQTQHSCLYEAPAYYFLGYFEELRAKVCKPSLKLILARTLKLFGLSPHLQRIQGVCRRCSVRTQR